MAGRRKLRRHPSPSRRRPSPPPRLPHRHSSLSAGPAGRTRPLERGRHFGCRVTALALLPRSGSPSYKLTGLGLGWITLWGGGVVTIGTSGKKGFQSRGSLPQACQLVSMLGPGAPQNNIM